MHNFFFKTLYQKRLLLLWWFIGITAVTLLTVSFYHSFRNTDIDQVFKSLPPAVQHIAGNVSSFKTVEGYLRQQIFTLRMPLLLIILSISLLVSLTGGDEQKGLLETQLSFPVSRTGLLLQKLAAALVVIILASLGGIAGIAIGFTLLHESFNILHVLEFTLNCIAVSLVYGLIAFMLAAATGRRALALGIGSGFAFASYLIDSMAPSVSFLEKADKLIFFHYYQNDPFAWRNVLLLGVTVIVLIVIACIGFNRRDIKAN